MQNNTKQRQYAHLPKLEEIKLDETEDIYLNTCK